MSSRRRRRRGRQNFAAFLWDDSYVHFNDQATSHRDRVEQLASGKPLNFIGLWKMVESRLGCDFMSRRGEEGLTRQILEVGRFLS